MSKPSYIAMSARDYDEGGKSKTYWYEIGAAWPTKSGNGFNVKLHALPIEGSFALFLPKDRPEPIAEA